MNVKIFMISLNFFCMTFGTQVPNGVQIYSSVDAATPEILTELVRKSKNDYYSTRDISMFTLQFEGMLRISEIISLKFSDLLLENDECFIITIRKTKVDQTGNGRNIIIQKTDSEISAFKWLQKYLRVAVLTATFCPYKSEAGVD